MPERISFAPKFGLGTKLLLLILALSLIPSFATTLLVIGFYDRSNSSSLGYLGLVMFLDLILVVFLGWLASRRFIHPILQLRSASLLYQKGDFSKPLGLSTGDEVGETAENLNRFAQNLQQVFQAIQRERTQLANQLTKTSAVLSTIDDAVIAVDLNRNISMFNHAAEALTGYTSSQVLGRPISQAIKIFEKKDEISPLVYCPISQTGDDILFDKDELTLLGNQKEAFVNLVSRQIQGGPDHNLGCIITVHDKTKEKQLESMKMDFVSMAAHELRTPLTSIKGYLSVFIQENEQKFNADQMMFLNRIRVSTEQLMDLVENILNVSRVERGAFSVFRQPLEWSLLVKQSVGDLTSRAKEKNIALSYYDTGVKNVFVDVDKLKITEVINNLIANAISYTRPGGSVTVWIETRGDEVVTSVRDTGVGIPAEAIPKLFTKFFRVSGKLEGTKGSGLGLYISKAIVALHHGKIWVQSQEGRGSVFSFSLPLPRQPN